MTEQPVEQLRRQLRDLGYLSRGIERWFALDPWSSRTFWVELLLLAWKGGVLMAPFAALPPLAVMLLRNHPVPPAAIGVLTLIYLVTGFAAAAATILLVALLLKLRPRAAIDSPRLLTAVGLASSAAIAAAVARWWLGFDRAPAARELAVGLGLLLLFFLVGGIIFSAAYLSFSIHESRAIPSLEQRSRTVPMLVTGAALLAAVFAAAHSPRSEGAASAPPLVVVSPTPHRVAFLGVDGLTWELLAARGDFASLLPHTFRAAVPPAGSSPERWATIATGTAGAFHGVHAVEGVRLAGSPRLLQEVSRFDVAVRVLAPAAGIAVRQPLPPTVRARDYVWELAASRAVPAAAVDWWTSEAVTTPSLEVVSQESVFARARGAKGASGIEAALSVDDVALAEALGAVSSRQPRLVAVYLPSLDIVLNRLPADSSAQLGAVVRATETLRRAVATLRAAGYDVVVAGTPGEGQGGSAVLASSLELSAPSSLADVAPTLLDLIGFPRSGEMLGRSLLPQSSQQSIASYGARQAGSGGAKVDEEYYQNLKSLGYVR